MVPGTATPRRPIGVDASAYEGRKSLRWRLASTVMMGSWGGASLALVEVELSAMASVPGVEVESSTPSMR